MRLELGTGRARVRLEIGGETSWPILDTGATGTYLPAERLGLDFHSEQEGTWSASGKNPHQTRTLRFYEATAPELAQVAGPEDLFVLDRPRRWDDGLIGMSLIQHYSLTLDYRRRRCLAEAVDEPAGLPTR